MIWGVGGDAPPFNIQIYIGFISYWWQFSPIIFHSLGGTLIGTLTFLSEASED